MSPNDTPSALRARRRRADRDLAALQDRPGPSKGFVAKRVPGTYEQVQLVRAAVEEAGVVDSRAARDTARFLVHLLTSTGREGEGSVPVPSKLIEREFRYADWRALEDELLIDVEPYSRFAGRCRAFCPAGHLR